VTEDAAADICAHPFRKATLALNGDDLRLQSSSSRQHSRNLTKFLTTYLSYLQPKELSGLSDKLWS